MAWMDATNGEWKIIWNGGPGVKGESIYEYGSEKVIDVMACTTFQPSAGWPAAIILPEIPHTSEKKRRETRNIMW